jgi:hypothetical protein
MTMKRTMLVALVAAVLLLVNPISGDSREAGQRGMTGHGSRPHSSLHSGATSYRTSPQRTYRSGEYRRGSHVNRYRYTSAGYRHRGYYPYRSHVYLGGSWWLGPGWGFWMGAPWPYIYPVYPYSVISPYYVVPPVATDQSPTTYIDRNQESGESGSWYYCRDPEGYYPHVQRCPSGWQKIDPATVSPEEKE